MCQGQQLEPSACVEKWVCCDSNIVPSDADAQDQNMLSSRKGSSTPFGMLHLEHNHFVPLVSL